MDLSFLIHELQRMQAQMGPGATVTLYDKTTDRTLKADPDAENWDFDIMRGDDGVVIEFE